MTDENITRVTALELMQAKLRGEKSLTDWDRVNAMTDEEITAAIKDDPDWQEFLDVDWSKATKVIPKKKAISIRLDDDVLLFFKAMGPQYQTRINEVLRVYMNHVLSKV